LVNAAKERFVLGLVGDYRDVAMQIGRAQWAPNKEVPARGGGNQL
jgi:hypothetical protein